MPEESRAGLPVPSVVSTDRGSQPATPEASAPGLRAPALPAAAPSPSGWRASASRAAGWWRHPAGRWLGGLALALLLTAPAWLPWTDPHLNLFWEEAKGVDDAKNHMLRLYLLGWMVQRGVWYPRWLPDLFMGYGYPVFNYYAPGFYYLALALQAAFRFDPWDGYRAAGVVAAITGAAGVYALAATLWRPVTGIVAAAAVLYGPYVFQTNLFQRGDIPEALGLALLPWLLLAMWRLWMAPATRPALPWLAATALIGAGELLVHNLTALTAGATAGVWAIFLALWRPSRSRLALTLAAGALSLALSAFFWLPAVVERGEVRLEILQQGHLDYRQWLLDPAGRTPHQQAPENRQTRAGLIDLHLHYPHQHQFIATLKPSLAQAGLALLTIVAIGAEWWRRHRPGRRPAPENAGAAALAKPTDSWPGSDHRQAAPGKAGVALAAPLLLVAVACWLLTFTFAAPVWAHVPLLPLLQLPVRLLGPMGICVAVAGAGGLSWLAAEAERLAGERRRWASAGGWAVACLAGAGVLFNSLGDREVPRAAQPLRRIDGQVLVSEEGDRFGSTGTTSGGEFTPRTVQIATYTAGQPRGRPIFERLYPEADWLGGLLLPLAGDLRLVSWRAAPLRVSVRVANDAGQPGQLALRQFVFPGWRAWVDGRSVPLQMAPYIPEQQAALGFGVVEVPPGEHTVTFAFGPTPSRLAGMLLSLAGGAALAVLLGLALRWQLQVPKIAAVALAGALVLAAAVLVWRGVRPAFAREATLAIPPAAPSGGVWRAPDLARAGRGGLIVNVAEAVRTGAALVTSPSGAALGPDRFVDVRQLTVIDPDPGRGLAGVSRREWLYLHPPSSASVDMSLPAGREVWFQAALALDPQVWEAPAGDGVRFQVLVAPLHDGVSDAPAVILDHALNPRAHVEERRWVPVEADLSPWGGQTVRLTLRTLPGEDVAYDWAGWGNPVVVVRETARVRPPVG